MKRLNNIAAAELQENNLEAVPFCLFVVTMAALQIVKLLS
jgi:hypothetical protein